MGETHELQSNTNEPEVPTASVFNAIVGQLCLDMPPDEGALFHLLLMRLRHAELAVGSSASNIGSVALSPVHFDQVSQALLEDIEAGKTRDTGQEVPTILHPMNDERRARYGQVIVTWATEAFGPDFVSGMPERQYETAAA